MYEQNEYLEEEKKVNWWVVTSVLCLLSAVAIVALIIYAIML
jgi:hypothetical protein